MADAEDRTEQPTARRLRKAREDGQVARSQELPAATIVIGALFMLFMTSGWIMNRLSSVFANGFVFDRKTLDKPLLLPQTFAGQLLDAFMAVAPVVGLTVVLALLVTSVNGGFLFSLKSVMPSAAKLNPLSGLKRMFGPRAWVELGKAIVKFLVVGAVLWWTIVHNMSSLLNIGRMGLEPALAVAGKVIAESILWVSLSLALIALADVPYQRFDFMKRMRMTKQEVKDEFKEMEGRPEVKAQIRRRQREIANARMIKRVKDADVVITNPQHFAVALEYDPTSDGAPVLVAKGVDHMAQRIREEADVHGIHIFEAPPLARALYYTTEAEQQVPEELYQSVAQVIAYVFSLEAPGPQGSRMKRPQVKVPPSMWFNPDGSKVKEGAIA